MKTFLITFNILLFSLVYSSNKSEFQNTDKLKKANILINKYLQKYMKNENPKPTEYKEARKIMFYDFDGDGDEDIFAFYTIEGFGGGNNWQHYIAIFEMENNLVRAVDDMVLYGDSWKKYNSGEFLKFKNGYIYFKLHGYDWETKENFIKTIGITMFQKKIVTDKPM